MLDFGVLGVTRPRFLVLTPVCVLVGIAVAVAGDAHVDWIAAALALAGALAAHVSVHALNEHDDFVSGLDLRTERTPFSGGSGTLVARPELVGQARLLGLAAFALTALCGLILLGRAGWALVPIGGVGLALVYFYTREINRLRWLCLIAPGLGFGPLMVVGTYYAVTGAWSWSAAVASLVPFFQVSNLLLLNQFPDVEADRSIGRNHLPIALGLGHSLRVYRLFALLAYVGLGLGVLLDLLPPGAMIALVTLPLALLVAAGVERAIAPGSSPVPGILPSMGLNVVLTLVTPALLSLGTLLGA